jgi:hypothetical protein
MLAYRHQRTDTQFVVDKEPTQIVIVI